MSNNPLLHVKSWQTHCKSMNSCSKHFHCLARCLHVAVICLQHFIEACQMEMTARFMELSYPFMLGQFDMAAVKQFAVSHLWQYFIDTVKNITSLHKRELWSDLGFAVRITWQHALFSSLSVSRWNVLSAVNEPCDARSSLKPLVFVNTHGYACVNSFHAMASVHLTV